MRKTARSLCINVIVLLAALCAFLAVLEAAVRLWWSPEDRHPLYEAFRPDSAIGNWHVENFSVQLDFPEHPLGTVTFSTNERGFREDGPTSLEKPRDTFRIVVLGDSHADNIAYNSELFPNLLENMLKELSGDSPRYEVIDAAVGGFNPKHYMLALKHYLKRFSPDMVVVSFYLGNDFLQFYKEEIPSEEEKVLTTLLWKDLPVLKMKRRVRKHCTIFRFIEDRIRSSNPLLNLAYRLRLTSLSEYQLKRHQIINVSYPCLLQETNQILYFKYYPDAVEAALRSNERILKELVREMGGPSKLLFIILPTKNQLEPSHDWDRIKKVTGLTDRDFEILEFFRQQLISQLDQYGIPFVDILSQPIDRSKTYFYSDYHMHPEGHKLIASLSLGELQKAIEAAQESK